MSANQTTTRSQGRGPSAAPLSVITVINPEDGKRYRMNIRGDVGGLSIGMLKSHLAQSCPIEKKELILKFNGTPLSNNATLCSTLGISGGSTLTIERLSHKNNYASFASPNRHALELQTIQKQLNDLGEGLAVDDDDVQDQIDAIDDDLDNAGKKRMDLERAKAKAERDLERLKEAAREAEKERERLAGLQKAEQDRAAKQATDLEARKERLRAEQSALRAIEMRKLENERRKELLQKQQEEYEADRARLAKEREEYDRKQKQREMEIRERELELEQQLIAAQRERKDLELKRLVSGEQRLMNHNRVGAPPPPELLMPPPGSNPHAAGGSPASAAGSRQWTPARYEVAPHPSPFQHPNAPHPTRGAPAANGVPHDGDSVDGAPERPNLMIPSSIPIYRPAGAAQQLPPSLQSSGNGWAPRESGTMGSRHSGSGWPNPADTATTPMPTPTTSVRPITSNGPGADGAAQGPVDARQLAEANLAELSNDLTLTSPLQFDENNTCVVSVNGEYTLLITFDAATERLYLYSTLATTIPVNENIRMQLYQYLLEGALLGREMCGGGVGASVANDFILMSTSIYLPESKTTALRAIGPIFVESLNAWKDKVDAFLCDVLTPTQEQQQEQRLASLHHLSRQLQQPQSTRHSGAAAPTGTQPHARPSGPAPAGSSLNPPYSHTSPSPQTGPYASQPYAPEALGPSALSGPAHSTPSSHAAQRPYRPHGSSAPRNSRPTAPGDEKTHDDDNDSLMHFLQKAPSPHQHPLPPNSEAASSIAALNTAPYYVPTRASNPSAIAPPSQSTESARDGDDSLRPSARNQSNSSEPERSRRSGPPYPLLGLEVTDGVMINGVHTTYTDGVLVVNATGPASTAGIIPHDFVRSVDGKRIRSLQAFQHLAGQLEPGKVVPFVVDRNGMPLVISARIGYASTPPGGSSTAAGANE